MSSHPTTHGVKLAPPAEEPMNRRLSDKIHDAIAHALSHGRDKIAGQLSLVCDSMAETEAAQGYTNRSDDEIKTLLDRRFSTRLSRRRRR